MPAAKPIPGTLRNADVLDLEELLGSTWRGFYLCGNTGAQGTFHHAYWRQPFTAGELCALFYRSQTNDRLDIELKNLKADLERANARADEAEAAAAFYRHELRAASKLGLMFSQLEGEPPQRGPSC